MSENLKVPVTAVVFTLAVSLLGTVVFDQGAWWVLALVGAVLAVSLWVMVWAGSAGHAGLRHAHVDPTEYAQASAVTLVLGSILSLMTDGAVYWSVAAILGGCVFAGMGLSKKTETEHAE